MSYKPKIKIDSAGNTKDLDIDAKTLEGASWKDIIVTNKDVNASDKASLAFDAGNKEFIFYSPEAKDYDSIIEDKQTQITLNKTKIDSNTSSINTNTNNIASLSSSKVDKGNTIANTDLNTVITSGFYRLNSGNTNAPSGAEFGQMLVVHGGADTITQVVFCYHNNVVWVRSGNPLNGDGSALSTPNDWRDWTRLASIADIPSGSSFPYSPLNGGLNSITSATTWGNQTGSEIASWNDSSNGGFKLRKDCPNSGQMSAIIDGRFYQNEGNYEVIDENSGLKQVAEGGLDPRTLPRGFYLVLPKDSSFNFEDGTYDGDDNANEYALCIGILQVASSSVAYIFTNGGSATNGTKSSRIENVSNAKIYKLYTY